MSKQWGVVVIPVYKMLLYLYNYKDIAAAQVALAVAPDGFQSQNQNHCLIFPNSQA